MSVQSTERAAAAEALAARAVEAWVAQGIGNAPTGVTLVKGPRRKSAVLRLHDAAPDGAAVIAKLCPGGVAAVERTVYVHVLPLLPVSAVRLYGFTERDGHAWLFLEDASGVAWAGNLPHHRRLATEWLAAAHLGATELVDRVELPARGSEYYAKVLAAASATLEAACENDAVDADGQALLGRVLGACGTLHANWSQVERILGRFPATLALPGFGRKNVGVRCGPHSDELLPFDFENAGWGPPAAELSCVNVRSYTRAVWPEWGVDARDVEALARVGSGLRALKSIPGEARTLLGDWPQSALRKLTYYASSVEAALAPLVGRR